MNCKYCRANCTGAKQDREIALCLGYDPPKTNADRIRSMTDEELAIWIAGISECPACPKGGKDCDAWTCDDAWLDWLKQECEP